MKNENLIQPAIIKISKVVVGIFAFMSIVAALNILNVPLENQIVIVIRIIGTNVALIAILAGTKSGRYISILFFSVIGIAGCFGTAAAFVGFTSAPVLLAFAILLGLFMIWISLGYIFGRQSKEYYRVLFEMRQQAGTT